MTLVNKRSTQSYCDVMCSICEVYRSDAQSYLGEGLILCTPKSLLFQFIMHKCYVYLVSDIAFRILNTEVLHILRACSVYLKKAKYVLHSWQ